MVCPKETVGRERAACGNENDIAFANFIVGVGHDYHCSGPLGDVNSGTYPLNFLI